MRGLIALIRTALMAVGAVLSVAMLLPSSASATHFTDTGSSGGPTVPWGFNEFWGFPGDGTWSGPQADLEIGLANDIMPPALSAHRLFVQWRRVEGTEDQYNWEVTDRAYQAMQANGAEPERKPVMVIHDAPEWARDPNATCLVAGCTFPPDTDHYPDWQEFVRLAVTRYPNVRAVEVWNEPNKAQFWGPAPDPGRYLEVLALAHGAVADVRPNVPVIIGGLAPVQSTTATRISSREFLREIYNQGGANIFEGIGTHAYPRAEPLVDVMWQEINRLFAVRDNHNDPGTPLWITEVGVSSDSTAGVGPERQGTELIRLYRSIEGHEIESFIIYRFHDCATVPCAAFADPFFNHTGVVDQSLAPKPAYCELGAAIGVACPDTPDTEAPQTTIDSGPQGKTTNASPSFEFSSSEPDSTFECSLDPLDSGAWSSCTSPKSYQNLAAGTYVFEVRATDPAGNTDPTPATRSFKVIIKGGGKGGGR